MLRSTATILAAAAMTATSVAEACSCILYPTQAEADRAGEQVYRSADLIVEATVGDVSAAYKAICPAAGGKPASGTIGRTASGDRPITVHRVLKGRAPAAPILAGNDATVYEQGCGVMTNSCDVGIASNSRTVLVLRRVGGARYAMDGYCSLIALRQSRRGQALFKRAG